MILNKKLTDLKFGHFTGPKPANPGNKTHHNLNMPVT